MLGKLVNSALVGSMMMLATPAAAAVQYCTGTVATSWIDAEGGVFISSSWRNDHTQICNVKVVWKAVDPAICVSWVAKLDAATAMNRIVTVEYLDAPSCDTLPTYGNAPAPGYVMLRNS